MEAIDTATGPIGEAKRAAGHPGYKVTLTPAGKALLRARDRNKAKRLRRAIRAAGGQAGY